MTAKERLTEARGYIQKYRDEFISERNAMMERHATMIEQSFIDDLVRSCENRLSEVNEYLTAGYKQQYLGKTIFQARRYAVDAVLCERASGSL